MLTGLRADTTSMCEHTKGSMTPLRLTAAMFLLLAALTPLLLMRTLVARPPGAGASDAPTDGPEAAGEVRSSRPRPWEGEARPLTPIATDAAAPRKSPPPDGSGLEGSGQDWPSETVQQPPAK